jgi:hypothetical protein
LKTIDAKDLQMAALPGHRACMTAEPMAARTAELKAPRTAALPDGPESMTAEPMVAPVMAEPTAAAMVARTAEPDRSNRSVSMPEGTAMIGRRPFFASVQR